MNSKASNLRLQTLLSQSGIVSRRGAVDWITKGRVMVNGQIACEAGQRVHRWDEVLVDGKPLQKEQQPRYFLLHKPAGYVTTRHDPEGRSTVLDLIPEESRFGLFPVGRLDYFSEGLLLLTNDGYWAQTLLRPKNEIEKEYEVTTNVPLPSSRWRRFEQGLNIKGVLYRARSVHFIKPTVVRIILLEGKNREIRKAVQELGAQVRRLVRIRIGDLLLQDLAPGKFRTLTPKEVQFFRSPS